MCAPLGTTNSIVAEATVPHTDLHVVDGELADPKLPIVPGHEIVTWQETMSARSFGLSHTCVPSRTLNPAG